MICKLKPEVLRGLREGLILHFSGCELTHVQIKALSESKGPLIFDKSKIDGLEQFLFSGEHRLKVAFTELCPKFVDLQKYAKKLSALMIHKIDLAQLDGNLDENVDALKALAATCAETGCDVCLGDLTKGNSPLDKVDCEHRSSDGESIDMIAELGLEPGVKVVDSQSAGERVSTESIDAIAEPGLEPATAESVQQLLAKQADKS